MTSKWLFKRGDWVLFRQDNDSVAWYEGTVVDTNDDGSVYRVQRRHEGHAPQAADTTIYTTTNIRAKLPERSMADQMMEAMYRPPEPEDPNARLYMEKDGGGRETRALEQKYGVDARVLRHFGAFVESRRKKVPESTMPGLKQTLESALPSERMQPITLLRQGEQDPHKMLQLADATRLGIFGWPAEKNAALTFYLRAAWVCSLEQLGELVFPTKPGTYPMGPPEALCAAAGVLFDLLMESVGTGDFRKVFRAVKNRRELVPQMFDIVFYLAHAARRDWECRLTLLIANALQEGNMADMFAPYSLRIIYSLQCEIQREAQRLKHPHAGDPSPETIRAFSPKATEIFLSLPAPRKHGKFLNDWHVELREIPLPPVAAFIVNPGSRDVKLAQLNEKLRYCAYTREAFQEMWSRMVFAFHVDGDRKRPAVLTFLNKPGDCAFAQFVREQIGENSGTAIRMVDHDTDVVGARNRREKIGDVMKDIEQIFDPDKEHSVAFPPNQRDMTIDGVLAEATALKEKGNECFRQGRLEVARRRYTEALGFIRTAPSNTPETYRLLGILLSNRAACFLKMVDGVDVLTAAPLLQTATNDCEVALDGPQSVHLLPHVREKLRWRQQAAIEMRSRLASRECRLHGMSVHVEAQDVASTHQGFLSQQAH